MWCLLSTTNTTVSFSRLLATTFLASCSVLRLSKLKSQTSFWFVLHFEECSIVAREMETACYLLWPRGKKHSRLTMALRSDCWLMRWENIPTCMTHHGGILKMTNKRRTPGGKWLLKLVTFIRRTDHDLRLLRLLLLGSKIKCKISSLPNQMYQSILPFFLRIAS